MKSGGSAIHFSAPVIRFLLTGVKTMEEHASRVLSIQSHVVSGYVGNKSAVFPLQVLGFEVDAINSVQFSNHTGYGLWKGQVLDDAELGSLTEGLHKNNLCHYTHLLTGYVGSSSFLERIAEEVKRLRCINPELIYVCDPVMGDNGKMYVPETLLPIYRDLIIPLADVVTPNQYEVELLTGKKIQSLEDAWVAVQWLHDKGVKTVVLSSTELGNDDNLLGLASSVVGNKSTKVSVEIPRLPASFTGSGDLFAALFLAWMTLSNNDLKVSVEKTVATMQGVLRRTLQYAKSIKDPAVNSVAVWELKLIQSKKDIENPVIVINAKEVDKC